MRWWSSTLAAAVLLACLAAATNGAAAPLDSAPNPAEQLLKNEQQKTDSALGTPMCRLAPSVLSELRAEAHAANASLFDFAVETVLQVSPTAANFSCYGICPRLDFIANQLDLRKQALLLQEIAGNKARARAALADELPEQYISPLAAPKHSFYEKYAGATCIFWVGVWGRDVYAQVSQFYMQSIAFFIDFELQPAYELFVSALYKQVGETVDASGLQTALMTMAMVGVGLTMFEVVSALVGGARTALAGASAIGAADAVAASSVPRFMQQMGRTRIGMALIAMASPLLMMFQVAGNMLDLVEPDEVSWRELWRYKLRMVDGVERQLALLMSQYSQSLRNDHHLVELLETLQRKYSSTGRAQSLVEHAPSSQNIWTGRKHQTTVRLLPRWLWRTPVPTLPESTTTSTLSAAGSPAALANNETIPDRSAPKNGSLADEMREIVDEVDAPEGVEPLPLPPSLETARNESNATVHTTPAANTTSLLVSDRLLASAASSGRGLPHVRTDLFCMWRLQLFKMVMREYGVLQYCMPLGVFEPVPGDTAPTAGPNATWVHRAGDSISRGVRTLRTKLAFRGETDEVYERNAFNTTYTTDSSSDTVAPDELVRNEHSLPKRKRCFPGAPNGTLFVTNALQPLGAVWSLRRTRHFKQALGLLGITEEGMWLNWDEQLACQIGNASLAAQKARLVSSSSGVSNTSVAARSVPSIVHGTWMDLFRGMKHERVPRGTDWRANGYLRGWFSR